MRVGFCGFASSYCNIKFRFRFVQTIEGLHEREVAASMVGLRLVGLLVAATSEVAGSPRYAVEVAVSSDPILSHFQGSTSWQQGQ